jgi:regulatory protein SWI5
MLSNPTPPKALQPRPRQHRRQNSTPTAFETVKAANLPNFHRTQSHHVAHRRGLSLDTRRHQHIMASPATQFRQEMNTVSNNTNQGLSTTPQHVLREAQQQRTARPGHGQPYINMAPHDENFLISPQGTPHSQRFETARFDGQQPDCMSLPYDVYAGPVNVIIKKNQPNYAGDGMMPTQDFELFAPDSALSTPTFVTFQESASASGWLSEGETSSTRRTSRRISNGIMDRVAKYEGMGVEGIQRPATPPSQNAPSTSMLTKNKVMAADTEL